MREAPTAKPQSTSETAKKAWKPESEGPIPDVDQPLSPGLLLRLQRTAGNAVVNDLLIRRTAAQRSAVGEQTAVGSTHRLHTPSRRGAGIPTIQRHAEGEALPEKADLVSEVEAADAAPINGGGDGDMQDGDSNDGGAAADPAQSNDNSGGADQTNANDQDTQDGGGQAPEASRLSAKEL